MKKNKKFIKFKDFTMRRDNFIYAVDDENEIHEYDVAKNVWNIVITNRSDWLI